MQVIRHLRQALHPIKLVAECISSEGSTLLAAEGAMKSMLAHLQNLKQNPIASDLVSHLKSEISNRRDETLISLLKLLHNPKALKEKDKTGIFRMAPRSSIEKLAKSLMVRLYKKGSHDTSESEQDSVDQENSNFEDTLFKSVAEATAPVKRIPSGEDGYKSLTKELAWYIESGKKSQNLEKLYQSLLTISPTSVAVERMFSTSGWLLNQRRARMSDSTLVDIIFLKSFF